MILVNALHNNVNADTISKHLVIALGVFIKLHKSKRGKRGASERTTEKMHVSICATKRKRVLWPPV